MTERYTPGLFTFRARPVLIGFWLLIGVLALSKWFLTLAAAAVNPLLGLLFAFFFSGKVGIQFTKAIGTTLLFAAVVAALNHAGFTVFAFAPFSLSICFPFLLLICVLLYLFGKYL